LKKIVPKYVFFTDAFPKTASGKVQKFALRERAERLAKEEDGSL
jgi:fatty-acyl-CoA synthase